MDRRRTPNQQPGTGLLIQGNFQPPIEFHVLRKAEWILAGILLLCVLAFLVIYSISVHVESEVAQITRETRIQDEVNKSLQTQLNRLRSFEKISNLAVQVPHLRRPEEILELSNIPKTPLPKERPERVGQTPYWYGY